MWLLFAFLTAFFTSLQDVFSKRIIKKVDIYLIAWSGIFFTLPFYCLALPFQPIPKIGWPFWPALAMSTLILSFAVVFYVKAIKYSDLSLSVPILTITPLLLLVTSPIILGEFPSPIGIFGVFLIISGSYLLFFKNQQEGFFQPFRNLFKNKGARYMLAVAVLYSVGANVDKIGVMNSSPFWWSFILYSFVSLSLTIVIFRKVENLGPQIKSSFLGLVLLGGCSAAALIFNMLAIKIALVPYVIAIKRTSVIITSLLGFVFFKEPAFKGRIVAIVLMVLGVMLISFS